MTVNDRQGAGDNDDNSSHETPFFDSATEQPSASESASNDAPAAGSSEESTSRPADQDSSPPMSNYNFFDYLLNTALGRGSEENGPQRDSAPSGDSANEGTGDAPSNSYMGMIGTDPAGQIIITVNYMFFDGGDGDGPGRTGSLVVTLPNNAANREPRAIQSFISLATRYAYSMLVSNANKKKGISPDKFRSFPVKPLSSIREESCSICFEQFEDVVASSDCIDDDCVTKKRKTNSRESTPSAATSNERDANKQTLNTCGIDWKHVPVKLPCGHIFGQSCLAHWLNDNRSCPLCRVNLSDETNEESSSVPPVAYLRFGTPGGGGFHLFGDQNTNSPTSETSETDVNQPQNQQSQEFSETASTTTQDSQRSSNLLRRATSVIFHPNRPQSNRTAEDEPGMPSLGRRRNSPVSPMINQILNLFGRNRRRRSEDRSGESSIFASGVSSRRTEDGVETITHESGNHMDNTNALDPDSTQAPSRDSHPQ
ncbi:Ubiquitin-protein ligase [Candidozyma auris]|uniref:RING-type domain-containing protein n=2 Tax=Candidozyma auris TaxID=498019 RepID=A0AB36W4F4_CANAR|nr:hypothetical protein QG37_01947 [[Candida] auris]PIS51705.1 hypothetical protein B9J08_003302 [[Candida] auris]PIS53693.1 hypothetical protein CJI97_003377 [[Candida] auris]QWW21946.1 hypothetical protein CA7LBN_000692 [[Candida] auris]